MLRDGAVLQDNVPLTGSTTDCPAAPATITYRLEAYNSLNQSVARDVAVTVQAPSPTVTPGAPAITLFTASSTSVVAGQPVTLTWSTINVTTHIDLLVNGQLISGNLPASGSAQHNPPEAGTKQYQLVIAAPGGGSPITSTVTVEVISP